jgi:CDP-2,3-bis-(O-geranylgeranyl)-sn-glycerol synthase
MTDAELLNLARALALLVIANAAPVVGARLFGTRFNRPLDGGVKWRDRRPLLGRSKTIRGVVLAIVAGAIAGALLGIGGSNGALFGLAAMTGDCLSSFIKRRMGLPPGSQAPALDQIPEAALPLIALRAELGLDPAQIVIVVGAFFLVEMLLWLLAWRLRLLRGRPY